MPSLPFFWRLPKTWVRATSAPTIGTWHLFACPSCDPLRPGLSSSAPESILTTSWVHQSRHHFGDRDRCRGVGFRCILSDRQDSLAAAICYNVIHDE